MAVYEVSLEELGPRLALYLERLIPAAYAALRDEVTTRAFLTVEEISPVASGKYRASHVANVGGPRTAVLPNLPAFPIGGAPVIEMVLAEAGPADSVWIANAAADEKRPDSSYAGLLEGGRRQYTRMKTGTTMWIGSTQAPRGIYGPAVEILLQRRPEIEAAAVERLRLQVFAP